MNTFTWVMISKKLLLFSIITYLKMTLNRIFFLKQPESLIDFCLSWVHIIFGRKSSSSQVLKIARAQPCDRYCTISSISEPVWMSTDFPSVRNSHKSQVLVVLLGVHFLLGEIHLENMPTSV